MKKIRDIFLYSIFFLILALIMTACSLKTKSDKSTEKKAFTSSKVIQYKSPEPLENDSQASFEHLQYTQGKVPKIAYLPPATEFNFYMAIGQGIKSAGSKLGVDTFMLAPQSGADINAQISLIEEVIENKVDAIILSALDDKKEAPIINKAVNQGIVVIVVNSDLKNFPTPIHGIVGYKQRSGTKSIGEYAANLAKGNAMEVGIIEGPSGYFSTERCEGFLEGIKNSANLNVKASADGQWNVEGGKAAALSMLKANPNIKMMFAANDYEIIGAQKAAEEMGRNDIIFLGNDGDTSCFEAIAANKVTATVSASPFNTGEVAIQVAVEALNKSFKGGYIEIPTKVVDKNSVMDYLKHPETLYPSPLKSY